MHPMMKCANSSSERNSRTVGHLDCDQDTEIIWVRDLINVIFDIKLDADGRNPRVKLSSVTELLSVIAENDMCDICRIR